MKIPIRSVVFVVLAHFLVETSAFTSRSLYQAIFPEYTSDHNLQSGLQQTRVDPGRNIGRSQLTKSIRDLADMLKKQMAAVQSGYSTTTQTPLTLSGLDTSIKRADHVQLGQGYGVKPLQEFADPKEVGFQVSLSHHAPVSGGPIVFDTIHESIPDRIYGYYDISTGKFTSPVTGTYLVSLSITNKRNDDVIYASVYVNQSERKMTVVSDGHQGVSQGSITGIVKLNKGDTLSVWIDRPRFAEVLGNSLSSFSAYLLRKH